MPPTLRVVLDQVVTTTDPQLDLVQRELARALIDTAPTGCRVAGIAPAGDIDLDALVPGLDGVHRTGLARRELAAAWQFGIPASVSGGMIHAASLMAPLVRHDRVHDHDQVVVTLWDLDAWEAPERMSKPAAMWQKAMLRRAEKHADAIVVPSHAMAARLSDLAKVGPRIRVIEGAAPAGFATPTDAVGRLRTLGVPEGAVVVVGGGGYEAALAAVAESRIDAPTVVLDAGVERRADLVAVAVAAGIPESRVHVLGPVDPVDRAAILGTAAVVLSAATTSAFPWRVVEALAVGAPVVARDSAVHREIVVDGGVLGNDVAALAAGLVAATERSARFRVLSADRGRGFSWRHAADRVWQLHAEI